MPSRSRWLLRTLVVLVALGALVPLARVVSDWVAVARVLGSAPPAPPVRGYDGVHWQDRDGVIVAAHVDARGPAARAGIEAGDSLFALDGQQYFGAGDVQRAVERASGGTLVYELTPADAAGEPVRVEVPVVRYPAFLYPLNPTIWTISGWGFALATFVHALALAIVAPLARRSRRSMRSTLLIAAGLLWVGGNFIRILIVAAVGAPELVGPGLAGLFDALTVVALAGWVAFPALLLHQVLADAPEVRAATRGVRWLLWVPPTVLGLAVAVATARGAIGPIPPDALLAPLLFYVCLYVGVSCALVLVAHAVRGGSEGTLPAPGWSRVATSVVLVLATLGAGYALGWIPGGDVREDVTVGLVVALQLFSLAPVGVVSLASMRYGRFDRVLTQAVVYVVGLGAVFFGVAVSLWVLRALAPEASRSLLVVPAWLLASLVLMERATARLRAWGSDWVQSDRRRARQRLNRFADRVRTYVDAQALADDTVEAVGQALGARSVVLFVTSPTPAGADRWVRAAYRPEAPHFTAEMMDEVRGMLDADGGGRIWSRTAELDEAGWPEEQSDRLHRIGVALVVPVTSGRGGSAGALILARKAQRSAVYNLEDAEMLRALCGQVALAVERLALLERERALMQETAEAQLTALRAQINPHFLFNALNTIAALIAGRPAEAEATVEHLAALFRHVLTAGARPFLPLSEEAALVRQYLAVERARFGPRLHVDEDLAPDTLSAQVPAFAVQTLVENAVKHGIERRRGDGRVRVSSRRADGAVIVEVADNGPGIPALFAPTDPDASADPETPPEFYGIGLRNVAARLDRLYGQSDLLSITSEPGAGTVARLTLPTDPTDDAADPDRRR